MKYFILFFSSCALLIVLFDPRLEIFAAFAIYMMAKRQLQLEPRLHLHLKILGSLHIGAMVSLFFMDQL